jgi:hypothetical protein
MLRFVVGVTAALLVGGGGYWGYQTSIAADVGAAAMAKVVCSCVFVDGRTLDACRRDDPPGFESIAVSVDTASRVATGVVLGGLVSRRAKYSEEFGCTLEP